MDKIAKKREKTKILFTEQISNLADQLNLIKNALENISTTYNNVHTHLLTRLCDSLIEEDFFELFQKMMMQANQFLLDFSLYSKAIQSFLKESSDFLDSYKLPEEKKYFINRILFTRLSSHITFGRYCSTVLQTQNQNIRKKSYIVVNLIEAKSKIILDSNPIFQTPVFVSFQKYLVQAKCLLDRINCHSSISEVLYFLIESLTIIQKLLKLSKNKLQFDDCIVWILLNSKQRQHILISTFILQYAIKGNYLKYILLPKEVELISLDPSAVLILLEILSKYDPQIKEWSYLNFFIS